MEIKDSIAMAYFIGLCYFGKVFITNTIMFTNRSFPEKLRTKVKNCFQGWAYLENGFETLVGKAQLPGFVKYFPQNAGL